MTGAYRGATWTKPSIDKTNCNKNYLIHFWNLSVKPSQSSCFKALYKRSNHLLLSLSPFYKALYKQKSLENVIFNGIAQSDVKISKRDVLKVSALSILRKTNEQLLS